VIAYLLVINCILGCAVFCESVYLERFTRMITDDHLKPRVMALVDR